MKSVIQQSKQKGGARTGAGRKPKDPTVVITFRVPSDKSKEIKPLVADYIKTLCDPNYQETQVSPPVPIKIIEPAKVKLEAIKKSTSTEPTMAELLRQSSILK